MQTRPNKSKILTGTSTMAYVNSKARKFMSKVSWKITNDYEDISFLGWTGTAHKFLGWSGEGSITEYKTSSYFIKELLNASKTGVIPEIDIIVETENPMTKETETLKFIGVQFTEIGDDREVKAVITNELPFSFEDIEIINSIKEEGE